MEDCMQLFDPKTADWFLKAFGKPTPVQEEAWPAIAGGGHVLVSAPTGTGKTLSAFLVFLDRFKKEAEEGTLKEELRMIYISPLKSLAADIRENLGRPLTGIGAEGMITTAIRTGDTTTSERQRMIRRPPHILITTPESLYLMLTSKTGQNLLSSAEAVVIDELHALIDTKRGAHLMLSLARLDLLCGRPLQRIGLSATISPLSEAARYLAPEQVHIIAPSMEKKIQLQVLGSYADIRKKRKDPVWQELSELVYGHCQGKRSVIAFVEGRRYAEKLAYYVNQIGGAEFARVHHGSLSKEQRQETETALREGRLRLLCATSSMELGIDVGEIDQVLQVGCPRTISSTMQRLGRAGHNPFRTSVMYLFPRTPAESILCGMTARLAAEGYVERMNPPSGCFDVLAQHLVSMAVFRGYEVDDVMEILPRAYPFREVTKQDVKAVLEMLAGDYEHKRDVPSRPRVLYDRIHERVEGDGYSRILAVSAGGTIPDKGLYAVRTEDGVKVGEVDEEFVYESQRGDRFILGAFAWKVLQIGRDAVTVTQAPVEGARLPFWKGELKGRDKETGIRFGRIYRSLQEAEQTGKLKEALLGLGLEESAAESAAGYLKRQIAQTGGLPDDRTILVEHFRDQSGNSQMMFHSVFGRRINAPLSLLAAWFLREELQMEVGSVDEEDGFLLYSYGDRRLPEGVLGRLEPEKAETILAALLPSTAVFNMTFRYNCGRALMMGARGNGRHPLWMQRLKSAEMLEQVVREKEHPLIRETRMECMCQLWDTAGVKEVLQKIVTGEVRVREVYTETPSPMSLPLQWAQEGAVMYDYAPTPRGIHAAVEEALHQEKELLAPGERELSQTQTRGKLPEDERQLHALLMTEGDLAAGELDIPVQWLEKLASQGRALYLEQGLWIAAEQEAEYSAALSEAAEGSGYCEEALQIVRRMLRYRGGARAIQTAARYGWTTEKAQGVLLELADRKEAVAHAVSGSAADDVIYYHAQMYQRARIKTVLNRREEIATRPPEAYAALLTARMRHNAPPEEAIRTALASLSGTAYPVSFWEEVLLPVRVRNYKGQLLDSLLASGDFFWHMEEGGRLAFDPVSRIDWEVRREIPWQDLSEQEQLLAETLSSRGASFMQALSGVLDGRSPYDAVLSLVEKGVVCADSFVPVRMLKDRKKIEKATPRQRAGAHVRALSSGRFDLVRQIRPFSMEEQMARCFDRYLILCRETAAAYGISWQEALSLLRVKEYTGEVRRGYFVKELSGAQFIRKTDLGSVTAALAAPQKETVWLNAADPMQPWGKLFAHRPDRAFLNVPGTAAALCSGEPAAVLERQGKILRIFAPEARKSAQLTEIMQLFAEAFRSGRIFCGRKRIVVSDYPPEAADALAGAGFGREMHDYVLYR